MVAPPKFDHIDKYPMSDKFQIFKYPVTATQFAKQQVTCWITKDGHCWNPYRCRWQHITYIKSCRYVVCGWYIPMHRAVADRWIPNPNGYKWVIFKDGDRSNPDSSNLVWSASKTQHIAASYGRWTVLECIPSTDVYGVLVKCKCQCGTIAVIQAGGLIAGHSRSCGCLSSELKSIRSYKHGYSATKLYRVLNNMNDRCYNVDSVAYIYYGSRGISVCDDWNKDVVGAKQALTNFITWAEANGYKKGLSIDRIDNDGNYEPSNCRWATITEQNGNMRSNITIIFGGVKACLTAHCRQHNISYERARYRIVNRGEDPIKVLHHMCQNN